MEKDKKKEDLQSRREFFKKAAKGILPVIGAIALSNVPLLGNVSNAHESRVENNCAACKDYCIATCKGTCSGKCVNSCAAGCDNYCSHTCRHTSS